jgi:hypothetical protein
VLKTAPAPRVRLPLKTARSRKIFCVSALTTPHPQESLAPLTQAPPSLPDDRGHSPNSHFLSTPHSRNPMQKAFGFNCPAQLTVAPTEMWLSLKTSLAQKCLPLQNAAHWNLPPPHFSLAAQRNVDNCWRQFSIDASRPGRRCVSAVRADGSGVVICEHHPPASRGFCRISVIHTNLLVNSCISKNPKLVRGE